MNFWSNRLNHKKIVRKLFFPFLKDLNVDNADWENYDIENFPMSQKSFSKTKEIYAQL